MQIKTLVGLSLLSISLPSLAASIKQAPIQQVTVYGNGALIERTLEVKQGQSLVSLDDLPHEVDLSQVNVRANNDIQIGSITNLSNAEAAESSPTMLELKQLTQKINVLKIDVAAAELQIEFLRKAGNGEQIQGNISQSLELRNQAKEALNIQLQANQQITQLEEKIEQLQTKLKREQASSKLSIETAANRDGKIFLSYYVPQARWQPYYRGALATEKQQLTLERKALVRQSTGEDWNNVTLILSTENTRNKTSNLYPRTWFLDIRQPATADQLSSRKLASPIIDRKRFEVQAIAEEMKDTDFTYSHIESAFAASYQANASVNIPSNSNNIHVSLASEQYPVQLSVRIIPAQSTDAMLNVQLPDLQGIWPVGALKLYRDGNFVNETQLNTQTTDYRQLPFGVDNQVVVRNVVRKQDNKDSGIIDKRSNKRIQRTYIIDNKHKQAMDIVLLEGVPLSQNDEIKVEAKFSIQPAETEWQNRPGIFQWRSKVAAGGNFTLDLDYAFSYPQKADVVGLP